jgi:hypothetical protein
MARFIQQAQYQPMKFQFDLQIHHVAVTIPYPVQLNITFKRGK